MTVDPVLKNEQDSTGFKTNNPGEAKLGSLTSPRSEDPELLAKLEAANIQD